MKFHIDIENRHTHREREVHTYTKRYIHLVVQWNNIMSLALSFFLCSIMLLNVMVTHTRGTMSMHTRPTQACQYSFNVSILLCVCFTQLLLHLHLFFAQHSCRCCCFAFFMQSLHFFFTTQIRDCSLWMK